ncbi:MAG: hypothetical protein HY787_28775 [Deltaproteobacteria bacterium]|nr:hypothetical protein [Deltaproteobacteria bacterium]
MTKIKKVSDLPPMDDESLSDFWEEHEPETFSSWEEGDLVFKRPPKKLIQLRLDPRDIRVIDKESKQTGIDRAQLVRSWVKEKINQLEKR